MIHREDSNAMRVEGICIFSEDSAMLDFNNGVTVLYETQSNYESIPSNPEPWLLLLRRFYMSKMGSILITDTKKEQFTVIRGQINMHDMDDVYIRASRHESNIRSNCNEIVDHLHIQIAVETCVLEVLKTHATTHWS